MTQGLMAGATNYQGQTKDDIALDIERWIEYSKETKDKFERTISELKSNGYWKNVPYSFKYYCESIPNICSTFIYDFNVILKNIKADQITESSIKLLKNIFNVAQENEEQSWRTFKEDTYWHDYGESNFKIAEKLYGDSRDFFVTLFDVANAASRLEDYMKEEKKVIHNDYSTHSDNSVHIGDNNTFTDSEIGSSNIKNKKVEKEKIRSKIIWRIIVPIIVGVIIAAICLWFGLK